MCGSRIPPTGPLISDFNLKVEPGTTVAIVGPTGAGKTTLVNLLMRFYEVDGGTIEVDGRGIVTFTRDSLRRSFGMVLQETWLFAGTIRENLAYGRPDATDEEIETAARAAHAHSFIRRLPEGYDTPITEDGGNLSPGAETALTIARAMLLDAPMLILDEATSSVDILTEMRIQRAFRNMMRGKTTFIIAHRLSTIRDADIILVLNKGDVVEAGSHEELLKGGDSTGPSIIPSSRRRKAEDIVPAGRRWRIGPFVPRGRLRDRCIYGILIFDGFGHFSAKESIYETDLPDPAGAAGAAAAPRRLQAGAAGRGQLGGVRKPCRRSPTRPLSAWISKPFDGGGGVGGFGETVTGPEAYYQDAPMIRFASEDGRHFVDIMVADASRAEFDEMKEGYADLTEAPNLGEAGYWSADAAMLVVYREPYMLGVAVGLPDEGDARLVAARQVMSLVLQHLP